MKMPDFNKTNISSHGQIGSIMGADARIKGSIESEGAFRLDGILEGNISSKTEVLISEKASVKGNVSASRVIVAGEVTGDVSSDDSIEIKKNGKVLGNISGNRLIVDEGASYKGRVTMGSAKELKEENPVEEFSDKVKEIIGF